MTINRSMIVLVAALIVGCDPGLPGSSSQLQIIGYAAPLSQAEFNQLPPEQQYKVASKLMGTMLRGIPVEEFFDLSAGMATLQPRSDTFLEDTREALGSSLNRAEVESINTVIDGLDDLGNPDSDVARYVFNSERPRQLPLARIHEYPISRDFFVNWMAYFLANTIMFSPALEMETTDLSDVQNMNRFLVLGLEAGKSVRQIIRSNLPSLARWRVSRSPENHALEAFELYLGLFETEVDSFRGGIACRDLFLTPEDEGYLIRRTDFPNTTPQLILETQFVITCDDLYDVVSGHDLLIPRNIEVVLNYIMSGRPTEERLQMIESIANSNPSTFDDIFEAILFSREYLLNTERPRSFEENLMPLLDALMWDPDTNHSPVDERIFMNMASSSGNTRLKMSDMGWDTMTLKIGRLPDVPLDVLSFGNYHKAIREEMLMHSVSYQGGRYTGVDDNGDDLFSDGLFYGSDREVRPVIAGLSLADLTDFMFLTVLQRKASDVEKMDLEALYTGGGNTVDAGGLITARSNRYGQIAVITFDYISRLPEFYYFRAVN